MKKVSKILVPFLAISPLFFSSCKPQEKPFEKIMISYGDLNVKSIKTVTLSDLKTFKDNKDNFLLVITTTCSCTNTFKNILTKYCTDNNVISYQIPYDQIIDNTSDFDIGPIKSNAPTFVIFENGICKIKIDDSDHENEMVDFASFCNFMNKTVILPKLYYVNEENIATMKESNKKAMVLYERSLCQDCTDLNDYLLKNYVSAHAQCKNIYLFDFQPFFNTTEYQSKKDFYGLSLENNQEYGFATGVFPTFVMFKGNEYLPGAVFFNEKIEENNNKFVVTNSYFTKEMSAKLPYLSNLSNKVIEGKEIPSEDKTFDTQKYIWKREKQAEASKDIFNAFMDYASTNVEFQF